MSGEKTDFNAMSNSLDFQDKNESCAWLEHCRTNLFGPSGPENPANPAGLADPASSVDETDSCATSGEGCENYSTVPDYEYRPATPVSDADSPADYEEEAPDETGDADETGEADLSEEADADETDETGEAAAVDYEEEPAEAGAAPLPPPAKPQKIKKPREKIPQFPRLKVEPGAPATLLSHLFNLLALAGPLVLTLFLLAQVAFPLLEPRNLWFGGETVLADVLRGVISGNDWLILHSNGQVYFDSPPLYIWFLAGIHALLNLPCLEFLTGSIADKVAATIFVGSAVSGLLLLWATLLMARCVANFDRRGQFASGVLLLGLFLFAGSLHYGSQDLFFCALVVASQAFMFLGLRRSSSFLHIGLGFTFAALAFLAKGLPGLLLPLLCAVLFAFWQGRPWRLLGKDFLLGFLFSLLPVVLWVGVIWADGHYEVVVRILREQFAGAVLQGWDYSGPWWYYLLLPLLLLPWIFLALFPNWGGLFSRESGQAIKEAFRGSRQGLAFVWLSLLCGLGGFFLLSSKAPLDLLLIFPPLAIAGGRIMLGLSPLRNMLLQRILAMLFLIFAFAFAVLPVYFSGRAESVLDWLGCFGLPVLGVDIDGVFIVSLAFLAAGCLLLGPINSRRPESTLLVVLLLVAGIAWPLSTLTAPSLGKLFSPAENGRELVFYVQNQHQPLTCKVDGAPFAYYAGGPVPELDRPLDAIPAGDRPVLLTSRAIVQEMSEQLENSALLEVASFNLADVEYVLFAFEALPEPVPPQNETQGQEGGITLPGGPGEEWPEQLENTPAGEVGALLDLLEEPAADPDTDPAADPDVDLVE